MLNQHTLAVTLVALSALLVFGACADRKAVSGGSATTNPERTKDIAVVVGIEDYECRPDSAGAEHAVSKWLSFFQQELKMPSSRLSVIRGPDATPEGIQKAISRAADIATEDSRLWFVFLGHGAARTKRADGIVLTSETETSRGYLRQVGISWGELLASLGSGTQSHTVAIFDTSFADEIRDGDFLANGSPPQVTKRSSSLPEIGALTVILAAASDDQRAGYVTESHQPAFSLLLISALQGAVDSAGTDVTAGEAMRYARDRLKGLFYETSPQAIGNTELVLRTLPGSERADANFYDISPPPEARTDFDPDDESDEQADKPDFSPNQKSLEAEFKIPKGYVAIPSGTFSMGSPKSELGRWDLPKRLGVRTQKQSTETLHSVTLTQSLAMKKTELAQGEWKKLMGNNPAFFDACGDDCPVERVNWFEAVTFLNKLSASQDLEPCYELVDCSGLIGAGCPEEPSAGDPNYGQRCADGYQCEKVQFKGLSCEGYRLPTEAEWEYAARAGSQTATYIGDLHSKDQCSAPADLDEIAVYLGNSRTDYPSPEECRGPPPFADESWPCGPKPVGQRSANAYGLYDMLGNVSEWTNDWYGRYPATHQKAPLGPDQGSQRVYRGCSWTTPERWCRAAKRHASVPSWRTYWSGFRPVRTLRVE